MGASSETDLTAQPENIKQAVLGESEGDLCTPVIAPDCLEKGAQGQGGDGEVKHPRTSWLQHGRDAEEGGSSGVCSQKRGGRGRKTTKVTRQKEACCRLAAAAWVRSRRGD